MSENTHASKLDELLAKTKGDLAKEQVRQEKANTKIIDVTAELADQAGRLDGQTQAIQNLKAVLDIRDQAADDYPDDAFKKQIHLLLREAMRRARAAYKA